MGCHIASRDPVCDRADWKLWRLLICRVVEAVQRAVKCDALVSKSNLLAMRVNLLVS